MGSGNLTGVGNWGFGFDGTELRNTTSGADPLAWEIVSVSNGGKKTKCVLVK